MSVSASVTRPVNRIFSVKDQAAHTKLKFRQHGQSNTDEMTSKNLKDSLLVKEKNLLANSKMKDKLSLNNDTNNVKPTLQLLKNVSEDIDIDEIRKKYDDEDVNNSDNDGFDSRLIHYYFYNDCFNSS